jgi:predicted Fe-S protein YdhL (DUF1289 family)
LILVLPDIIFPRQQRMTQTTHTAASPCINVCTMNSANGLCQGCLRTLDEISIWSHVSNVERLDILAAVARRREALGQ